MTVDEIASGTDGLYIFNNNLNPILFTGGTPSKAFENVVFPLQPGNIVLG